MRRLRAGWRLLRVVLHGLHGLAIVQLRFPALSVPQRHERIRWWSAKMLRMLGMRLDVQGRFRPGAKLVVANHVSWIDVMAIHAVCPEARFVSKADVHRWPLAGRLAGAAGTLYIERERARDALRLVHQMAEALQVGDTVAIFPEGTTADGQTLLPFHANLLQAAIATNSAVQPVAIRFSDAAHAVSPAALYLGDTTFAQSLLALARGDRVKVHLVVLPAQAVAHADRRRLAEALRAQIGEALN
jgi:1-acyl-sn-glycerol-3-phosphate acyltransferase